MKRKYNIIYTVLLFILMLWTVGLYSVVLAEEADTSPIEAVSDSGQTVVSEDNNIGNPIIEENETADETANLGFYDDPYYNDPYYNDPFNDDPYSGGIDYGIDNGIPVITLNIDESQGTIQAMNLDPDHDTYCYGTMDFTLPYPEFRYVDLNTPLQSFYDLAMQIKGRGNSTWAPDKKPYKIKLEQSTDLLGLGSEEQNKHWVLIANSYDPTLIRDRMTAYIGENTGFEYTPLGVPVDVVMNDKYLGSYLLMEHVRLGKGRVDIDELYESDVDPPDITGGYIVQIGTQTKPDSSGYFTTRSGLSWNNHSPSFDVTEDYENDVQKNYIRSYMQMVEDILYSDLQTDAQGNPYSTYMDLTSAAKYWLVQTISQNPDFFNTGSTYLYKTRDTEQEAGKLYWGPLWDFDLAWGGYITDELSYTEGFNTITNWILPMLHDTSPASFYQQIQNEWPAIRNVLLDMIQENGIIDQYYYEIKRSQAADSTLYPTFEDYLTIIENTKLWIEHRINWLDTHLPDLQYESRKVKILEEGQPDIIYYVRNNSTLDTLTEPEKEGYVFIGWMTLDGTPVAKDAVVNSDLILIPQFITIDEAIIRGLIPIQNQIIGVPTSVQTNTNISLMSMILSLLGVIYIISRKYQEII